MHIFWNINLLKGRSELIVIFNLKIFLKNAFSQKLILGWYNEMHLPPKLTPIIMIVLGAIIWVVKWHHIQIWFIICIVQHLSMGSNQHSLTGRSINPNIYDEVSMKIDDFWLKPRKSHQILFSHLKKDAIIFSRFPFS